MTDSEWFENVENFRPLRGGRRADTLNEVATGKKVTVDEAERMFLKKMTNNSSENDPLESMYRYTIWFEEQFPSGKQKYFFPILYKICTTYCNIDAYKNDDRMLKLWLKLAENFPESGLAVMEFAFARGSCRQLAKFYTCWSRMYRDIGWWNNAREKIHLGLNMAAVPIDILHQASDELESYIMRETCLKSEERFDKIDSEITSGTTRETLGKLRGVGRRHFIPTLRIPQEPAGTLTQKKGKTFPNLDRFEICTDEQHEISDQRCIDFQTPVGPRIWKNKSRIAESLALDLDYQALFGTFDEKIDLQISNEENIQTTLQLTSSKLPDIPFQTPVEKTFDIYHDMQEKKARLKLKKELIKEMSIEEGFAKSLEISNNHEKSHKTI